MTLRRLGVLLAGLPPDSALASALAPDADPRAIPDSDPRLWSTTNQLLADISNQVAMLRWVQVAKSSKTTPAQPKLIKPPKIGARTALRPRLSHAQRAKIHSRNHGR